MVRSTPTSILTLVLEGHCPCVQDASVVDVVAETTAGFGGEGLALLEAACPDSSDGIRKVTVFLALSRCRSLNSGMDLRLRVVAVRDGVGVGLWGDGDADGSEDRLGDVAVLVVVTSLGGDGWSRCVPFLALPRWLRLVDPSFLGSNNCLLIGTTPGRQDLESSCWCLR